MTDAAIAVRGNALFGTHLEPATLILDGGLIADIRRGSSRDDDLPSAVIEAEIVSPGLIDLQVNGAIGKEVSANPADIDAISAWLPSTGCTAWLPTVVSSAADSYPPIFAAWPDVSVTAGAVPLGLHLEGPFLAVAKKGAHNPAFIESASDDMFDSWLDHDMIRIVTLAAERVGNHERIARLVERGVLVSLGHTNASFEEFVAGIDSGARKATHLFNAMSSIHHREPGAMVAAMTDGRITAGLIPDGVHTHPAMVRLAIAAMGVDRLAIVSDMMSACGLGPGTYPLGSMQVTVDDHAATLADGTLAGSILTLGVALRNLVGWTDASPAEALHMMTAVPARLLGDHSRGDIRIGTRADLALWNNDLTLASTIVDGRTMWPGAS